jgi:D-sedoheptulose 7-phosphate isomerase
MTHTARYLSLTCDVARAIPADEVERLAMALVALRERRGRLFVLGVGGSAANAGHAVNDFRKLAGIEAYAPSDNVSELTARTNDEGWETVFEAYLRVSQGSASDAVLVFSVGGGDATRNVSRNIVRAVDEAKSRGMHVFGIVGRDGGYTRQRGDPDSGRDAGDAIERSVSSGGVARARLTSGLAGASHEMVSPDGSGGATGSAGAPAAGRAVFLDRDGTLNRSFLRDGKAYPPATVDEFELFDGVPDAVRALKDAGFAIVVVTNQPDNARTSSSASTRSCAGSSRWTTYAFVITPPTIVVRVASQRQAC